jgi:uncharacterized membrane protein YdcZ (DUF606 family)
MASEGGIFLLFFLFGIVITLFVYVDAQDNSPQSAVLWALVAFFGGILGLLLYLLLGRKGHSGRSQGRGQDRHHRAWSNDDDDEDAPPPGGRNSLDGNDGF